MKNYVDFLTGNYVINIAIGCYFAAQVLKIFYNLIRYRKFNPWLFFSAGSLPSSHSAMVVGTTTAVAKVAGLQSVPFAIALVFSMIVMYDATGVRRAAGEQAKVLNYMMDNWEQTTPEMFQRDLKELIGHTPLEVLSGAVVGLVIALIF